MCAISPLVSATRVLSLMHSGRPRRTVSAGGGCVAIVLAGNTSASNRRPYAVLEAVSSGFVSGPDVLRAAVKSAARTALQRAHAEVGSVDFIERAGGGGAALEAAESRRIARRVRQPKRWPVEDDVQRRDGRVPGLRRGHAWGDEELSGSRASGMAWCGGSAGSTSCCKRRGASPVIYQALLTSADTPIAAPMPPARRRLAEEGVAITGLGVVVPGADNAATFWRNLLGGVDAIKDLPPERWDVDRMDRERCRSVRCCRHGLPAWWTYQRYSSVPAAIVGQA